MTVTIVMRAHGRPVFLARAIASVKGQTSSEWHLVIVNNGGDPSVVDNVVRVASRVTMESGTISVVHLADRVGMEEATNVGLAGTDSEFFAIHDEDDSWSPRFLAVATASLAAEPGAAAVVTGVTNISETFREGKVWPVSHRTTSCTDQELTFEGMVGNNTFPRIAAVFRRSVITRVGGFDPSLEVLGDWEFNLRAVTVGDFVTVAESLARCHTRTPDSDAESIRMSSDEVLIKKEKSLLQRRWLAEPDVDGVNKGALSISRSRIDRRAAKINEAMHLLRKAAHAVRHPRQGLHAIIRRLRRMAGR